MNSYLTYLQQKSPKIQLNNFKTTFVVYVDEGGENCESLWGICMPLDHVDGVWERTLCNPLSTRGPAWRLFEDLKLYEKKFMFPSYNN